MCGIFGVLKYKSGGLPQHGVEPIQKLVTNLAHFSTIRGKDASGICVMNKNEIVLFKHHIPGREISKLDGFNKSLTHINVENEFKCVIGHTRAQTQGTYLNNKNNHPIICGKTIGVHNGIIKNDSNVFRLLHNKYKSVKRIGEVDSEAIFALINYYLEEGKTFKSAITLTSEELMGSYACAVINAEKVNSIGLFKSSLPLHMANISSYQMSVFASSREIIQNAIEITTGLNEKDINGWLSLDDNSGFIVNMSTGDVDKFLLSQKETTVNKSEYQRVAYNPGGFSNRNWKCPSAAYCFDDCKKCATAKIFP